MPVTKDRPGPYAPTSAILGVIGRHRDKGLPVPINADVLGRAGISDSLIPRTLQALQALDLITEGGKPTDVFEGIRLAPEAEYKQRLADWLSGAYADALSFVDPATDDETKIRDAFRSYNPSGQRDRMVTLFTGLFTAAGVMPERAKVAPARRSVIRTVPASTAHRYRAAPKPTPQIRHHGGQDHHSGGLPAPLAGLLAKLPEEGQPWPKDRRDQFLATFGAVLDFCFPIGEPEEVTSSTETAPGQ